MDIFQDIWAWLITLTTFDFEEEAVGIIPEIPVSKIRQELAELEHMRFMYETPDNAFFLVTEYIDDCIEYYNKCLVESGDVEIIHFEVTDLNRMIYCLNLREIFPDDKNILYYFESNTLQQHYNMSRRALKLSWYCAGTSNFGPRQYLAAHLLLEEQFGWDYSDAETWDQYCGYDYISQHQFWHFNTDKLLVPFEKKIDWHFDLLITGYGVSALFHGTILFLDDKRQGDKPFYYKYTTKTVRRHIHNYLYRTMYSGPYTHPGSGYRTYLEVEPGKPPTK